MPKKIWNKTPKCIDGTDIWKGPYNKNMLHFLIHFGEYWKGQVTSENKSLVKKKFSKPGK